jgi:hypothetical protein
VLPPLRLINTNPTKLKAMKNYLLDPYNKTNTLLSIYLAAPNAQINRIRKLTKSIYNCEFTEQQIIDKLKDHLGVSPNESPVERVGLFIDFPDCWSILLLAKTQFKNLCKIWGDEFAADWFSQLQKTYDPSQPNLEADFWWLYLQLEKATAPIHDRQSAVLERDPNHQLRELHQFLKDNYGFELVYEMVCAATVVEWNQRERDSESVAGNPPSGKKIRYNPLEFPLNTNERQAFVKAKQQNECIARSLELFPTQESVIEYFAKFWKEVKDNRGADYLENLRLSLAGNHGYLHRQSGFYSATEHNFKHFLNNLNGFKKTTPWRIVKIQDYPLSWQHEGLLLRFGWKELETLVVLGLLHPLSQ